MAIHHIDFHYGAPEMKQIWEEDSRLRCLFKVEAALARAEEVGSLPAGTATDIAAAEAASPARAKQIEDEIGHYMMTVLPWPRSATTQASGFTGCDLQRHFRHDNYEQISQENRRPRY